ncbi:RES domain-containing protein (plasmid) [Skermanella rosea]|nr:RES domain-containing protein [Skermanella rosea]
MANEDESRRFGTAWLAEKRSAALLVPSVIIPVETNILINPGHPDAAGVSMIDATEFVFDDRLFSRLL